MNHITFSLLILLSSACLSNDPYNVTNSDIFSVSAESTEFILDKVKKYLNGFKTLRAQFTQLSPRGSRSKGVMHIWRPGKMRLSYQSANINGSTIEYRVLLADEDTIYDHDFQSCETAEIPLEVTPASIILRDKISFADDIQVIKAYAYDGAFFITLAKREDLDAGTLTLVFNKNPLILLEWEVTDSQGLKTKVIFNSIETGIPLDINIFTKNF